MALSAEDKAEIIELMKGSAAPATPPVAPAAPTPPDTEAAKSIAQQAKEALEAEKGKTLVEQAKAAVEADKAAGVALNQIQESIKFNISVKDFIEKNKNLLPEESDKILAAIATKTFKDDNERANLTRKNLLDSFLEKQDNISVLTASMQSRANYYKSLAESDKEKRSSEFWDLAEVGIALKGGAHKAEALKKINGGNAGDGSKNPLEAKILAAAEKKFNQQKN